MNDNLDKYKSMIFDTCDELAENVFNTFLLFVSICSPWTDEQRDVLMFDSMEVWECI